VVPVTATGATLESLSPSTGESLGKVELTAPRRVQQVVDDVAQVQPFWAQLTLRDRARYLERAAQVVIDESDQIRDLIVREQGKPRNEAFSMEILPTIDSLRWIGREGQRLLADEKIPMSQVFLKTKSSAFTYEPLGVIAVIAPWNYPWSIPFGEVAMALMAGNGVVLKPASLTPLIGERIQRVFERAGVPDGLVRVVHGPGTGKALVESSAHKIFFTGSVETGRSVAQRCAQRLKGCVLELGGKDPMIVLADANLDHAVAGALWGGFANAGQTCSGVERVYVMRDLAERFIAGVVAGAERLRVGDPLGWDTEIGPMVSREQYELVRELVDDAVASGARLECGGPAPGPPELAGAAFVPRCGSCVRRSSGPSCRSPWWTARTRRWGWPTTRSSGWAHRCGPRIGTEASGSPVSCRRGWCGSTTTCSAMAPASARGAGSRSPGWVACTPGSACTSAST
jgi:acyl-CoA reductase-like NAD-dependent aldehyde dehydrogenase